MFQFLPFSCFVPFDRSCGTTLVTNTSSRLKKKKNDLTFCGRSTSLRDESQNGLGHVTNDWQGWFLTVITDDFRHTSSGKLDQTQPNHTSSGNLSAFNQLDCFSIPKNKTQRVNRKQEVGQLSEVDCAPTDTRPSHGESQLYIFEGNEAGIKMILKGRSPTMRHVSRTHRFV